MVRLSKGICRRAIYKLSSIPSRGAGEMAQKLKAHTVPTEDLRSVLSAQSRWVTIWSNCCSSSTRKQQTPWSMGPYAYLLFIKFFNIVLENWHSEHSHKGYGHTFLKIKGELGELWSRTRPDKATANPQQLTNLTPEVVPRL